MECCEMLKRFAFRAKMLYLCTSEEERALNTGFFPLFVRPAWAYSNGCKSLSRPDNGKATAKDKGVRGDAESDGSRRQTSALTDRNMI